MYAPNTILRLKDQKPPTKVARKEDPDTGRVRKAHEVPFPYNQVRVIGRSPIAHTAGDPGVILEPLSYHGSTLDEPLSKIQRLYDVESEPVQEIVAEPIRVVRANTREAGLTPEEVFTAEAEKRGDKAPEPGQIRARTAHESPLGDDIGPAPSSPLGD